MKQKKIKSGPYFYFVGLGVDVSQLLVDGHGLTELQRSVKHILQRLRSSIHVLQV